MIAAWVYEEGFSSLDDELAAVRRRIDRGRERAEDRDALEALELARGELQAMLRADRRVELELLAEGHTAEPLDVALIQAEELIADGLSLRIIPPETREALRREREADWALILYGLDGSGGSPATT